MATCARANNWLRKCLAKPKLGPKMVEKLVSFSRHWNVANKINPTFFARQELKGHLSLAKKS